ncbi:MAG: Nif3-like dinuclear metal center hexameric protein [Clostridiales bacterium]|nr:Nif3-like dinuclear metal center hexameric protein [Clostridiales bacterium]
MSQTVNDIVEYLERLAPPSAALEWDNSGLLIGERDKPVRRILVALDCTDEAVLADVDLIITHHPLIFRPIKSVTSDSALGRRIITLIRRGVSLYSSHTNLDIADGGVNDALFNALGLIDKEPLMPPDSDEAGLGRVGSLPAPSPLDEFAGFVGKTLGIRHIRYFGNPSTIISRAGLICGSGSGHEYFKEASAKGCQAYITGDIKYHDVQDALEMGLCLIDATHLGSEILIVDKLVEYLRGGFPKAEIRAAEFDKRMEGWFGYND